MCLIRDVLAMVKKLMVGGGSVVGTHHHYADNFHPANAIEVGNVWGTQMEATLRVFSTQPIREAGGTTYVEGQVFNHLGIRGASFYYFLFGKPF